MTKSPSLYHVLKYAPQITPAQIKRLGEHYTLPKLLTLSAAVLQSYKLLPETIAYLKQQHWPEVEQDLTWAEQPHHHIFCLTDDIYPPLLKEIAQPPLVLYAIGDIKLLYTPQIAIVGTRKPTINGSETARQFAAHLAKIGLTITSGLAAGIDGASHEGALQAQGKTIAVLGNGLNHTYPPAHKTLQAKIAEQGLLLSEFSPNMKPRAEYFPQRNRIISGLSIATLVVEAAVKSGSLITARLACEQGREVFAIPGSIHNPQARGCHALIKQGAKLIETVDDILEELPALLQLSLEFGLSTPTIDKPKQLPLDKKQSIVLKYIDYVPTPLDIILERCGEDHNEIFSVLMQLELNGYVASAAGSYTRITKITA